MSHFPSLPPPLLSSERRMSQCLRLQWKHHEVEPLCGGRQFPTEAEVENGCSALASPSLPLPKLLPLSWWHEVQCGRRKQVRREGSGQLPGRDCGGGGFQLICTASKDRHPDFQLKNVGGYVSVITHYTEERERSAQGFIIFDSIPMTIHYQKLLHFLYQAEHSVPLL